MIIILIAYMISLAQAFNCNAAAVTERAKCNQYFAYVKSNYCTRYPTPGDGISY